jgi:2-(1,2-epoxy-1,2-dihydrophenyl)acetyl-CoA isomerase
MVDVSRPVLLERCGEIATIVLNRPTVLNAVNQQLADELLDTCKIIASDHSVRVVVLRGAGRSFMAGGDLAAFLAPPENPPARAEAIIRPLNEVVSLLADMPTPVVACLQGPVAGAGVSLALACDLAIAADDVKFNLAYARIGASLDVSSSWSLPRVVGLRKAMELSLLADNVDATEAFRLGLVNRVVPLECLATETTKLAMRLAAGPAVAYRMIKRLLRQSFDRSLQEQMEDECKSFCICAGTDDFREGLMAFQAKQLPNFRSR